MRQFVRKVLLAGTVVGVAPVPQNSKCDQICRASELPIYMSENDCDQSSANSSLCPRKIGILEGMFGAIRRQVWGAMDQCTVYQKEAEDVCARGSEYASSIYTYLSEEADDNTKMGAVGAGALTGLILGLRGGILRKLFYSGVGAYGMASVCYPQKTADYTQEAIQETKRIATIAYNFIYGGKPSEVEHAATAAQQIEVQASDELVQQSHASAFESCHCPVGACLGRHDQKDAS